METVGTILMILKIGILFIIFLYSIFAFIVLNQIQRMNSVVKVKFSSTTLVVVGIAHLLLAISLFLLAIAIL